MAVSETKIEIGLNAAVISMVGNNPSILRISGEGGGQADSLPYGPFDPTTHRTMEINLRHFIEKQTAMHVGYVEQLYTFGDRGRNQLQNEAATPHVVSVGYLALTRIREEQSLSGASWKNCYTYLPWEDWRKGRPVILDETILPALYQWAMSDSDKSTQKQNEKRIRFSFGSDEIDWDDERVLERYELLYTASLVTEAVNDGRIDHTSIDITLGTAMNHDHRRILATALARLRAKLKYRPVIFELMQDEFTLFDLQQTVESILGKSVHKQNFRRLVESNQLVEPTGKTSHATGGRPAALFKFRREVMDERPAPGLKMGKS